MFDIVDDFAMTLAEKIADGVNKIKETDIETPQYEQLLKNIVSSIHIVNQFSQKFNNNNNTNSDHIMKGDK